MRKLLIVALVVGAAAGGYFYFFRSGGDTAQASPNAAGGSGGMGGFGGFGGRGGFSSGPMTVELAKVTRADMSEYIQVVGNLIGAATVQVVPKFSGRLQSVDVRLGDRVGKGQTIAQIEDREIREQVKQAEASFEVARATVRQREADLELARISVERSRSLFSRQLLPRQTLDDAEARYQSATAQIDLARAQFEQAKSRLDELRINLSNTRIASPVDGFVGRRSLDPGAFVGQNTPVVDVVDIHLVRLVTNLVEKDLRRVVAGTTTEVEVDAYPGEQFTGRVARLAPVLDPATRTAEVEIEVANPDFRLKPGMYSRVRLLVGTRDNALVIPRNALVDVGSEPGVFTVDAEMTARFNPVKVGLQDASRVEIMAGLNEGQSVVTTGATALRDGVTVLLPGSAAGPPAGGAGGARGGRPGMAGAGQPGQQAPGRPQRQGGQRPPSE
jgi:RND family efflux transporter MFP subunit